MNIFTRQNESEIFKYFDAVELIRINKICEEISFSPRQYVIEEGNTSRDILVIKTGSVSVCLNIDGNENLITKLYAGDVIGEINFVLPVRRTAFIRANESVEIIKYPYEKILELMNSDMTIAAKLFASLNDILAQRLIRTTQKIKKY